MSYYSNINRLNRLKKESFIEFEDDNMLGESFISKSNENVITHKLPEENNGSDLQLGDQLEIRCFKFKSKSKSLIRKMRPFAKYTMLVDLLRVKTEKNNGEEASLTIEDFLVHPKTGLILKVNI